MLRKSGKKIQHEWCGRDDVRATVTASATPTVTVTAKPCKGFTVIILGRKIIFDASFT